GLDIEARQPHRATDGESERRDPAEPVIDRAETEVEGPEECQNRRSDAEGDDVGKGVELEAEVAGGIGHSRDAAVEHVEHDRDSDRLSGGIVVAPHRRDDGEVTAEDVADRKEAGQDVDAAAKPSASRRRSLAFPDAILCHETSPSTLVP